MVRRNDADDAETVQGREAPGKVLEEGGREAEGGAQAPWEATLGDLDMREGGDWDTGVCEKPSARFLMKNLKI